MRDAIGNKETLDFELELALRDARNDIHENGTLIYFINRNESQISRDKYNSIQSRTSGNDGFINSNVIPIYANNIQIAPNRRELEKAGLTEVVEISFQTARLDWIEIGIDFNEIDKLRPTIKMLDSEYEIKEKGLSEQYLSNFLFVNFGVNKI